MRKTSTIIVIWAIFILVTFIGFNCRFPEEKPASYNEKTIKKELNNLPQLKVPSKSGHLLKALEANGYLKEETYVGMAEDRNNEVFNCTYNNTSIFLQTFSKYYYKNNLLNNLNLSFKEDYDNAYKNHPKVYFLKKLNKNAFVYCYSEKDSYVHKTLNKREIIVKLAPDKILTYSSIRFSEYNLNLKKQKEYFYKHIVKLKRDIKTLNKVLIRGKDND